MTALIRRKPTPVERPLWKGRPNMHGVNRTEMRVNFIERGSQGDEVVFRINESYATDVRVEAEFKVDTVESLDGLITALTELRKEYPC